jgi:hypothetical protein
LLPQNLQFVEIAVKLLMSYWRAHTCGTSWPPLLWAWMPLLLRENAWAVGVMTASFLELQDEFAEAEAASVQEERRVAAAQAQAAREAAHTQRI